jgi:glycosyltransferase involved in cell wall biosynthesis
MRSRLVIVGDGSQRALVEAEAAARPGEVELVPWSNHDDLPVLLRRMHVLALPSIEIVQHNVLPWMRVPLREQFGRVLVEAMACGIPCVATSVGEVAEVIADAGLIVEQNRADQLESALARVRDDRELAARLRRSTIERSGHFDWDHIAAGLHAAWRQLERDSRLTNPLPLTPGLTAAH